MNCCVLPVIFAITLCVRDVTEALAGDASMAAANRINDQKYLDDLDDDSTGTHRSTASDDVDNSCSTIDDVTEARRSLCPVQCRCWPLDGHEAWTRLTVDCRGIELLILGL